MGGDGGSIPTRRCLVKYARKVSKKDQRFINSGKYNYCQLSRTALKKPILASRNGKLYNKDCVIEYLLDKNKDRDKVADELDPLENLHSLKKDYFQVEICENKNFISKHTPGENFTDAFPFHCPVTHLDFNGVNPVVFSKETKQVVTLKALRDANLDILPKSCLKFETENTDEEVLHPIFDEKYENSLVCPVTSKNFGHVFLLYPQTRSEIGRAKRWRPESKKKKNKQLAIEDAEAVATSEIKPKKKGVKFASFVENNEGGFTNKLEEQVQPETEGLKKLKSLKNSKPSKSSQKPKFDLTFPKTQAQKPADRPKAIQKVFQSSIKTKAIASLAGEIAGDVEKSKALQTYRDMKLIGDTSKMIENDGNALKHMMGNMRSYYKL